MSLLLSGDPASVLAAADLRNLIKSRNRAAEIGPRSRRHGGVWDTLAQFNPTPPGALSVHPASSSLTSLDNPTDACGQSHNKTEYLTTALLIMTLLNFQGRSSHSRDNDISLASFVVSTHPIGCKNLSRSNRHEFIYS